jgi:hypothetical protein
MGEITIRQPHLQNWAGLFRQFVSRNLMERIIPPITPNQPEKVQISLEGAEHLRKEIRVENTLQDESGNEVALEKRRKGRRYD